MDYLDSINTFLDYAETVKNYSPATIYSYRRQLIRFGDVMEIKSVNQLTLRLIDDYQEKLIKAGTTTNTLFNITITVRAYLRWLERKEAINFRADLIDVPRRISKPVKPLTIEEIQAILDNLFNLRDRIMFLVACSSGVRINELINLKVEDIDGTSFNVVGKGRKQRPAFLIDEIARYLYAYMTLCGIKDGHIFLTSIGVQIKANAFRRAIKQAAKRAGIERRVYPHIVRNTFGSLALKNGMDVRTVQGILGHEQIQTTMRYLQIDDPWKKEQFEKHQPIIVLHKPVNFVNMAAESNASDSELNNQAQRNKSTGRHYD